MSLVIHAARSGLTRCTFSGAARRSAPAAAVAPARPLAQRGVRVSRAATATPLLQQQLEQLEQLGSSLPSPSEADLRVRKMARVYISAGWRVYISAGNGCLGREHAVSEAS